MFNKKQARLAGLLLIAQAAVMVWFNIYQKLGFSWDLVIEVALVGVTGLLILLGKPKFSFITMTIKAAF